MGVIAAIMQGKVEHQSHLRGHAVGLNAASKSVRDIFPANSADGDTRAKAEIWSDPDGFKQAVMDFEQAADGLLSAVDSGGNLGDALKALGGTCKGCHDDFRAKQN